MAGDLDLAQLEAQLRLARPGQIIEVPEGMLVGQEAQELAAQALMRGRLARMERVNFHCLRKPLPAPRRLGPLLRMARSKKGTRLPGR